MVLADDRILEYLQESDHAVSATQMHDDGGFHRSRPTISQRLNKLADHGLVQKIGNGMYVITDKGEAYLNQEYDVDRGVYLDADDEADDSAPSPGEGVGGT
jgi:repressor of nif and glnA expression